MNVAASVPFPLFSLGKKRTEQIEIMKFKHKKRLGLKTPECCEHSYKCVLGHNSALQDKKLALSSANGLWLKM